MTTRPDVRLKACDLYFLPVTTRVPLKFGSETTRQVTCARVRTVMEDGQGKKRQGWGETPLSVAWLWPSESGAAERDVALRAFCREVALALVRFHQSGHPLELGHSFMEHELPALVKEWGRKKAGISIPWLAALACFSPFDLAMHDAYATGLGLGVYQTYGRSFMNRDLSWFFGCGADKRFAGKYPEDFLAGPETPRRLVAWHLVGGRDLLADEEPSEPLPDDGYPTRLIGWIRRDGLTCLKIKLRGDDAAWDWRRLLAVGDIALTHGVGWLSADFNCMVREPGYVIDILDRLAAERPDLWRMLLYVEQPFPYDLENRLDVRPVSSRKPLFLDESAHSWRQIALGRDLGWTGAALKTCKTQTGAMLGLSWARAHGMGIMVQDLTNPMLAQIAHVQLAAHAGTIMGVESNSMQFYPDASLPEAAVHPGLYRRRGGCLDLSSLGRVGFGYRIGEVARTPPPGESFA